jgi:predicted RNA-binding protein with PIN domain
MQSHRNLAQKDIDLLNAYSPLNAIRIAMARGKDFHLLIDGHNVMHQLKPAWGIHFEKNGPGKKARDHLISKLIELTKNHPKITIDVWFDSPDETYETVNSQLRVKFSGGTGSDRADKKIEADLGHLKAQSKQHDCYVVSADRDVMNSTIRLKANSMSPLELFSIL